VRQKIVTNVKQISTVTVLYSLWLGSIVVWVLVAIQLQRLILLLGNLLIQSPAIRPAGWSSATLPGINRCAYLVAGIVGLGIILYSEYYLREGYVEKTLWRRAGRLFLIAGSLLGLSIGLVFLLIYVSGL
jgi:hypothetical protein